MTKFFDPKEEVIDIKLTSHGKHLLSKGKLIPHYYAFFDDDVIYDLQYASASIGEHQDDIQARIQDETPRLRVQSQLSGVETNIKRCVEMVKHKKAELGDKTLQPLTDKHFALPVPLGNSTLSNRLMPSWDAFFIKGKMLSSVDNLSNDASPHIKIPQIDCEITYTAKAFEAGATIPVNPTGTPSSAIDADDETVIRVGQSDAETFGAYGGLYEEFEDGSSLKIYKDSIILEINEENTDYLSENFDIEVYEVLPVTGSSKPNDGGKAEFEELVPLYFARQRFADLGVSYVTDEVNDFHETFPEEDPNYVEYFFEINVDREIEPDTLCAYLPNEKARRKSIAKEFDCPDKVSGNSFASLAGGLYESQIEAEPEVCD